MGQPLSQPIEFMPAFKDRTTGLILFGVLQIVLALFCLLEVLALTLVVGMALGRPAPGMPAMNPMMILPAVFIYLAAAVWLITMGIGSIRSRRWARALILAGSWVLLVMGIVTTIGMFMFLPALYNKMGESGQIPRQMVVFMQIFMFIFMILFLVVVPGAFVLFYRGSNVKATCEFKDPKVRWTDRCPIPILAVSLALAFYTLISLFMAPFGFPIPVLGQIATGSLSAVILAVTAVGFAYATWGFHRLKTSGWWCLVLLLVFWLVSVAVTFSRVTFVDFYRVIGMPQQQLDLMEQVQPQMKYLYPYYGVVSVALFAYLIYIRKFFKASSVQS